MGLGTRLRKGRQVEEKSTEFQRWYAVVLGILYTLATFKESKRNSQ